MLVLITLNGAGNLDEMLMLVLMVYESINRDSTARTMDFRPGLRGPVYY
jgi:hypothetical protein